MNALVQTRVDQTIKNEAADILHGMGLTVSDAVRLMLIRTVQEKRLPFEVWRPNAKTVAAINESLQDQDEEISLDALKAQLHEIH